MIVTKSDEATWRLDRETLKIHKYYCPLPKGAGA
jgi:hypothetical protein